MKRRAAPPLARILEIYSYDPETGLFTYLQDMGPRGKKGVIAGGRRKDGYIGITVDKKIYLAHHLAWFIYYGEWLLRIDHDDRNKANNKIKNLRPATAQQNAVNSGGWTKRKYDLPKGVYYDFSKSTKPFAAIRVFGRLRNLGYFESIEEAELAYRNASLWVHGDFSPYRGR